MINKKNKKIDENNNNGRSVFILVTVFLLIIIGLLVTIVMLLNNDNKLSNNKDKTNNVLVDRTDDNKITITDYLKYDLGNKIDRILFRSNTLNFKQDIVRDTYAFNYIPLIRDLTEKEKINILLSTVIYDNFYNSEWRNIPSISSLINERSYEMNNSNGVISYYRFNDEYRRIFGSDITSFEDSSYICNRYYYIPETQEVYKIFGACGGASAVSVVSRKTKFESSSADSVDVYVNFAFIAPEGGQGSNFALYGDFDYVESNDGNLPKTTYKNLIENLPKDLIHSTYKIKDEQLEKYSQYKFTFKKKGDNLYFEKVTKVK